MTIDWGDFWGLLNVVLNWKEKSWCIKGSRKKKSINL